MTPQIGPAERIAEGDLLRRLLADYGIEHADEDAEASFVTKHIALLEGADNEVAARTGFVLKRAQDGFGLGYKVPLVVLAMGRTMLGLDLAVAAPFVASNPVAFTCAAVGAVYYGYQALSDDERLALVEKIGLAFDFGIEVIKGIVRFSIDALSSMLNKDLLAELKGYVAEAASYAGSSLYAITGSLKDRLVSVASTAAGGISWLTTSATSAVGSAASSAAIAVGYKGSGGPDDENAAPS